MAQAVEDLVQPVEKHQRQAQGFAAALQRLEQDLAGLVQEGVENQHRRGKQQVKADDIALGGADGNAQQHADPVGDPAAEEGQHDQIDQQQNHTGQLFKVAQVGGEGFFLFGCCHKTDFSFSLNLNNR